MGMNAFVVAQWDRVAAWVAVALGLLLLLIGWLGVSDTGYVFEQIPYVVSGGIGGLFLLGLGAMLWLSADLRDEWRKLDTLELALRDRQPGGEWDDLSDLSSPAVSPDSVDGTPRHRARKTKALR
jgi:hypothetical protein